MEKLEKNKAIILFYGVMIMLSYLMIGRLEQLNGGADTNYEIVYSVSQAK